MNTGISTYIWVLSKDKPAHRAGKVQLIDASHCFEPRRKSIGTKRNDITDVCRELIVTAYGEFANGKVYGDKNGIYCESKVFESVEFGYNKIVVERPQRDEAVNVILKRGKPVPDTSLRDTENVPLVQDIDAYFAREVLPYAPDAWIDHSKTKVGYEIPMTRYFYEYQAPEAVEDIVARITALEQDISAGSGGQIADGVLQAAKDLCRCHRVGTRQGRLRAGHPERCSRPRPQGAAGRDHFEDQREFKGEFTNADRVLLTALHDRLLADPKLAKLARSSDPQIFTESIFPKAFDTAAQDSYLEAQDTFSSLFEDTSKYKAIMSALAEWLYGEFRKK